MCLECGGLPLVAQPDGEWAVEAGPVSALAARRDAIELLSRGLVGFDATAADKALAAGRLRVCEGLGRATAEALAQRLGPQQSAAAVTRGPTPRLGAGGSMKNGLPLAGVAGGAALALATPLGPIGWAIGGAAAVALGVVNARRRMAVLGRAPVLATAPGLEDVPGRLGEVARKLDADARNALLEAIRAGFGILARLSASDDIVSLSAGGIEGGMADAAVGLVKQAITAAEAIALDGSNETRLGQLRELARAGQETLDRIRRLDSAPGGADTVTAALRDEAEQMSRTVRELNKNIG